MERTSILLSLHIFQHCLVDLFHYRWTNIGVPVSETSRTLYPADFAVSNGNSGLFRVPFPSFSDNKEAAGFPANDTAFAAVDHSFPRNYYSARENFIRSEPGNVKERMWMGIVDTATGKGTVHLQTRALNGRKYWAWGHDPADLNRMNFLSSCDTNPDIVKSYCM